MNSCGSKYPSIENRPIFIVGAPRSGTTLMARIIGNHSNVFMPGETHFFEDIYSRRSELGGGEDSISVEPIIERLSTIYGRYNEEPDQKRIESLLKDEKIVRDLEEPYLDYGEVLSRFMEVQMKSLNKNRWGNNTPRDIFFVREILSYYPNAIFIVCVRDVRDFLRSYKTKWRTALGERSNRLKSIYHPFITSILWKSSIKCISLIEKHCDPGRYIIVHYEKLVSDPEKVTKNICKVIGEEYEAGMLDVRNNNSSRSDSYGEKKGIYRSSIGTWREELSDEEIYLAQIFCSRELTSLGYNFESVDVNLFKLAKLIFSTPFALIRGIKANKHKRGPLVRYIYRRLTSLF